MHDLDLLTNQPIKGRDLRVYLYHLCILTLTRPALAWHYLALKRRSGYTSPETFWQLLCVKMGENSTLLEEMQAVDYRNPRDVLDQITKVHQVSAIRASPKRDLLLS